MAWDVSFDPVDADDAIAWFADRLILTREQVDALRADVAKRAFYVSGVAQLDLVAEVWDAIDEALKQGTTLEDFKASVGDSLKAAWGGDVANPPARIETIFRTNVQSAYTAGRYEQATDPDVIADRPFWMFDAILDDATTEVCEACDGTIRAADDAWWKTHLPPLHFQCRSHFVVLTKDQAHERGVTTKPTSIAANDGFGAPPGKDEWEADGADYPAPLWKQFIEAQTEAPKPRTSQDWAADIHEALKGAEKDGGAGVRALLQEQIGGAGFTSRDVALDRPGAGRLAVQAPKNAASILDANAVHNWDGSIEIARGAAAEAGAAYALLAKGEADKVSRDERRAVSMLFHEELHGFSPMVDWRSYKGVGVPFEEAGTEILARMMTRNLLGNANGVGDLPKIVSAPDPDSGRYRYRFFDSDMHVAYNRFIHGIMAGIAEASGKMDADLGARVEKAFVEIRSSAKASFEDPDDQMDALLASDALGLTATERAAARKLFTTTDVLQRYTDFEQEPPPKKRKPKKTAPSRALAPAS